MPDEINLDGVKSFIDANKDSEEVKSYIGGLVTPDRVTSFLDSDDGKKLLQPKLDDYARKAIESHDEKFKANELPKLVEEQYKKLHPDADPKDAALAEVKAQLEQMKAEAVRKDLTNKALKIAGEKKLPAELVNFFVGNDEDETCKNLGILEKSFTAQVNAVAEEWLKNGYKPPKQEPNPATAQQQAQETINKIFGLK